MGREVHEYRLALAEHLPEHQAGAAKNNQETQKDNTQTNAYRPRFKGGYVEAVGALVRGSHSSLACAGEMTVPAAASGQRSSEPGAVGTIYRHCKDTISH